MKPCQLDVMFSNIYDDGNSSIRVGLCRDCNKVALYTRTVDGIESEITISPLMAMQMSYGLLKALNTQSIRDTQPKIQPVPLDWGSDNAERSQA